MLTRTVWFRIVLVLIGIMIALSSYYLYRIWDAANDTYEPPNNQNQERTINNQDSLNFLVLGIDSLPKQRGRADTIMIVTLNPKNKTIRLTNIPRDTYVTIPGREHKDKINHSHAFGGPKLTQQTVEELMGIPIHGYVKVNMPGMKTVIDELGGIVVNVPFSFTEVGYTFKKGKMKLNGAQALEFARMRKLDREGDHGRIKRQQEVIRAMIQKGTQMSSILNMDDILQAVGSNVKTNISPFEALKLSRIYNGVKDTDITTSSLHGEGFKQDGIYYYRVSAEEVDRVRREISLFMQSE